MNARIVRCIFTFRLSLPTILYSAIRCNNDIVIYTGRIASNHRSFGGGAPAGTVNRYDAFVLSGRIK